MQRACFVIAAAVFAWFVIGVDGQTPSSQPAPPAQSPAAASPSQNAAPAISLVTQPTRQVFSVGERFTVVATTSDDTDSPDRLQYRWTVKNLESGVEQAARSTNLQQVRTRGGSAGRYEYKCRVSDSAGASSEASLVITIEDSGKPEVVGLAFDDNTAALHRVTPYWREGFPAIRRGEWAVLLVSVRNFIAGPHFLKVFVDGNAVVTGVPGSTFATQNLGGTSTEQYVRLFVPPNTAVGAHKIEVAAIKRAGADGAESETSRIAFSPQPIVLFNPWRSTMPDPSVYGANPLPNNRATFYTRGTQDLIMGSVVSKVYDVTPYEKPVVTLAQEIVASMPAADRSDAARVVAAMSAHVHDKVPKSSVPEAITLTSILRSIGIPARTVTLPAPAPDQQDRSTVQTWTAVGDGSSGSNSGWTVTDQSGGADWTSGLVAEPGFERATAVPNSVAVQKPVGAASLPIAFAIPSRVNAGATFAVSARLVNGSSAPVQDASLTLVLPAQLRVVGGTGSASKPVIPPGADLRMDAMVQALSSGSFLAGAASESSAGPGEEHAQVIVTQPGRLFVAGQPALAVKAGDTVTVSANVILDGVEPAGAVEVRLEPIAPLSIAGDARKVSDKLAEDDVWTPSWPVLVNAPGTYRLPVRVKSPGIGETSGEILLVTGATDPDADMTDDFNDDASLGYRSVKAIGGVVAVALAIVGGAAYWLGRRTRRA